MTLVRSLRVPLAPVEMYRTSRARTPTVRKSSIPSTLSHTFLDFSKR